MRKVPLIYTFQKAKLKHCVKFLALLVVGYLFTGCTTAMTHQKIEIQSSADGSKAAIYDKYNNKVFESGGAATAYLKRGGETFSGGVYRVEITKEGYEPMTALIGPDFYGAPYSFGTGFISLFYPGIGALVISAMNGTIWSLSPDIITSDIDAGTITVFNRSDWYCGVSYGIPWLGGTPQYGEIVFEGGQIWRNGVFTGSVSNLGFGYSENKYGTRFRWTAGLGYDLGGVYDLPLDIEGLQLVFGGALGFWYAGDYDEDDYDEKRVMRHNFNWLSPFVKLRYKSVELSYRGFLGNFVEERYRDNDYYYSSSYYDEGFGWNNHQLAVGFYFEGKKRNGTTLRRK